MHATGETGVGRRLALIIATSSYADPTLAKLRAPGQDASALAEVLGSESIGGFAVDTVLDAPADTIRRRVAQFCARGETRDLALVYLSCHGLLDDRGRLYYATSDTDRELLSVTAVQAAWLNDHLEDCRCRRQIVILDCCHSGAFAKGAKGESALALRERFEGRGRVVLTASRATEYSFEGGHVLGEGGSSVFTGALVDGLRTGDADIDGNGLITVTELYDYAYDAVKATGAAQTPSVWSFGAEGSLLVAHSPRGAVVEPAPLPVDLSVALESPRPRLREGAVGELADLLEGPDAGLAMAARNRLAHIAAEDLPAVAAAARRVLDAHPEITPAPGPAKPTTILGEPEVRATDTDRGIRTATTDEPSRGSRGAAPVSQVAKRERLLRAIGRHRGRTALLIGSGLLALAVVVLIVAGVGGVSSSGGEGATHYKYGASITMRPLGGAQERARAHFVYDLSTPVPAIELTDLKLARGTPYKLMLFDDLSSVKSFTAIPDFSEIVKDTGADGTLDPGDADTTTIGLPDEFRQYRYFGIAAVKSTGGQMKLYRRIDELPAPK